MRKLMILAAGLLVLVFACSAKKTENKAKQVFIVTKQQDFKATQLRVYIDLATVKKHMGQVNAMYMLVTDLNNGNPVSHKVVDADRNGIPEGIFFATGFEKNEPLRTFCLSIQDADPKSAETVNAIPRHDSLKMTFLSDAKSYIALHGEPSKWSDLVGKSILATYPDPRDLEIFSPGKWCYTNGFFLNALSEMYVKDKNPEYLSYIKKWAGIFVTDNGQLDPSKYEREIFELDNIPPGRLLLFLNQLTGEKRYKVAADQLVDQLNHQPRTSDGGYWHKKVYPNQMWLDGIYMADVYLAQYASVYKQPKYFDEAAKQIELMYKHACDPKTGLLYHGWDESKNKVWANPETGASPEFWGRALGWYEMALVDGLDYFPIDHPERAKILKILRDLSESLAKYQDKSGMWYQVVDKGDKPDNWVESSCTAMFAYAFAKGYLKGYLSHDYLVMAQKAFEGLKDQVYFDEEGKFYLNGTVKVGTLNPKVSKGDYNYYIGVDRRMNDFKGVAAFMYLALALENANK